MPVPSRSPAPRVAPNGPGGLHTDDPRGVAVSKEHALLIKTALGTLAAAAVGLGFVPGDWSGFLLALFN